ncbi:unnamed protein product, partial [Symbiodinium necroappetens]
ALMESCVDSGALAFAFDVLEALPTEFKSGKWTEERYNLAMRAAGLDMPKELKRKAHVKPNEALSKEKPRMIITSGDEGVVRHILDSGLLEHALFNNPLFEQRSFIDAEGDGGLMYAAIKDRIKDKAHISVKNVIKAVIFDMIRESGDRGTSVLNFITNLTLFYANVSLMLEKKGMKDKAIKKLIAESLKSGSLANLMGEGDDGLQVFERAFVELFGDKFT